MNEWKYVPFSDLFEWKGKSNIKSGEGQTSGKYKLFVCSDTEIKRYDKYLEDKPSLVFGTGGKASCHIVYEPFSYSTDCVVAQPLNDSLYLKFYYYYLRRNRLGDLQNTFTGSGLQHTSKKKIDKILVPFIDYDEQKRIVSRIEELFSELDSGEESLNKIKETLKLYRQVLLHDTLKKLKGNKTALDKVIVSKPRNGYSPKAVDYVTSYKNLTLTSTTSGEFKEDCFKYVDIDIDDNSYLWVKNGDILIQRSNTVEYVGTSVIYNGSDNRYVYPDLMMKIHVKDGVNPYFILYQLKYAHLTGYYRKNATGTAGNMPKINQTVVMNTPLIMTSLDEQERIVKELDSKLSKYKDIERMVYKVIDGAEAMRQSILKEAFEGRL